jgi:hypothetical protein
MLIIAYATGVSFERFRALAAALLVIALGLAAVCSYQAQSELECIKLVVDETGATGDKSEGEPIGINCAGAHECYAKTDDYSSEYVCEKWGLFDTFSIGSGRVRWRGLLADPNELALALGTAMSFAFAIHASMKKLARHLILYPPAALVFYCVVKTESRGGVLVVLAVIGLYFIRRYGLRGIVLGLACGAPLLMLGGREGEEAEASALERLGALYEGIDFFRSTPVVGLGYAQFSENYFITAHNSYLLAAAELGFPGFLLWSILIYLAVKIPFKVSLLSPTETDPRLIPYAVALVASYAGMYVGIFFLSFCYHAVLYVFFGMSGGMYLLARKANPAFEVKLSGKEVGILAGLDAALLAALFVYTRIKGAP